MTQRRRTLVIDWSDGDVEDADEITVYADSDNEAASKAREKWRMTIGANWPGCRIVSVKILSAEARKKLA